jgi:hypothetical protein
LLSRDALSSNSSLRSSSISFPCKSAQESKESVKIVRDNVVIGAFLFLLPSLSLSFFSLSPFLSSLFSVLK